MTGRGHGWQLLAATMVLLGVGGCSTLSMDNPPGIYRIDVQQGNLVTREMLDRIEPGMDKRRVRLLLGTPLIADPFNQDRWDYVYQFTKGRGETVQRRVVLHFVQDRLDKITGDLAEVPREHKGDAKREQVVTVPQREEKGGLLRALTPSFLRHDETPEPAETAKAPETEAPKEGAPAAEAAKTGSGGSVPASEGEQPAATEQAGASTAAEQSGATQAEAKQKEEDTGFLKRLFSGFSSSGGASSAEDKGSGETTEAPATEEAGGSAAAPEAGETASGEGSEGSSAEAQSNPEGSGFLRRLLDRIRGAAASTGSEGKSSEESAPATAPAPAEESTATTPAAESSEPAPEAGSEPATESEDDGFFSRLLKRFQHGDSEETPSTDTTQPASE